MTTAAITAAPARWWAVPAGLLVGAATGVLARAWMRWISNDPEFTWPGTIAIIVVFSLFGTAQSAAWVARRAGWSRRRLTVVRSSALVLSLGLFVAAGAVMLPTVVCASLAHWRTDWWLWLRGLLALGSLPIVLSVSNDIGSDMGWNLITVGRIATFVALYAVIVFCTWPTVAPVDDGWRTGWILRSIAIVGSVAVIGVILLIVAGGG